MKLVNLAFRVARIAEAEAMVANTPGWRWRAMHQIGEDRFLEAEFGGVKVNFFEVALYDDRSNLPAPGFLHASYGVPDLAAMLADPAWAGALMLPPQRISGGFGTRDIAFFEPLPGCRIELMEQLDD